ncbi:MAG: hypothetical protein P8I74_05130 [Phycisphaerales bacterium]|nr:hypothetical protein [Phycisphaerales bacterium]
MSLSAVAFLLVLVAWIGVPPLVRSIAVASIQSSLGGPNVKDVTIGHVEIGWSGPQIVKDLRVVDLDGATVVDLSIAVDNGLIPLALGGAPIRVAMGGEIVVSSSDDGSYGFTPIEDVGDSASTSSSSPIPSIDLLVSDLQITLRGEVAGDQVFTVKDASAAWGTHGKLDCSIEVQGANGKASVAASVDGLIGDQGDFAPMSSTGDLRVDIESMPIPVDGLHRIESMSIRCGRESVGADLRLDGACRLVDSAEQVVVVELEASAAPEATSLDELAGRLSIEGVSASILRPLLGEHPIPVPFDASVSRDAPRGPVVVSVSGPGMDATVSGTPSWSKASLSIGAVDGTFEIQGRMMNEFVEADLEGGLDLHLEADRIVLSPTFVITDGRVAATGPLGVGSSRDGPAVRLQSSELRLDVAAGDGSPVLDVRGSMTFDEGVSVVRGSWNRGKADLVVESLPTEAIDLMADLDGMLSASLGSTIDVIADGSIIEFEEADWVFDLSSPQADLHAPLHRRGEFFLTPDGESITGSLVVTPRTIAGVLLRLGPGLSDVHGITDPVMLEIADLKLPVDGTVSALDARVEIAVGEVMIDSRAEAFGVLDSLFAEARSSFPATLDPILFTIDGGVLVYEQFVMHVNGDRIELRGSVDLNTGMLDLVMDVPVNSLGMSVKELRIATAAVAGEVRITGTTSDPIVQFRPVLNPGGIIESTEIRGILDRIPGNQGLLEGLGGLFDR